MWKISWIYYKSFAHVEINTYAQMLTQIHAHTLTRSHTTHTHTEAIFLSALPILHLLFANHESSPQKYTCENSSKINIWCKKLSLQNSDNRIEISGLCQQVQWELLLQAVYAAGNATLTYISYKYRYFRGRKIVW